MEENPGEKRGVRLARQPETRARKQHDANDGVDLLHLGLWEPARARKRLGAGRLGLDRNVREPLRRAFDDGKKFPDKHSSTT